MYNQYKSCRQGTNISVYSALNECYTRLRTHLNFCAMCCGLMRQYLQRSGVHNLHNLHVSATDNTHYSSFQHRCSVNCWAGIVDDYIIRPYVIQDSLSGVHYTNFLEEMLPLLLKNVPLHVSKGMWFHGSPPHFACEACNWFDNNSRDKLGVEV
jgi:hypothetical protein